MWRAEVTLTNGDQQTMVSATRISFKLFEGLQTLLLIGEFDLLGFPLEQVRGWHIFEMGVTAA